MPYVSFASSFIWIMVIGLLGPSVPAIVRDLNISYAQAGMFFTMLSLGSLFGTSIGTIISETVNRKALYAVFTGLLAVGLVVIGFVPGYIAICLVILGFSLLGSPIGSVGQSVMLDMFPGKRGRNLSLQTFFAALGNFLAPLIVTANIAAGVSWRWPFIEVAGLTLVLLVCILVVKIPNASVKESGRVPLKVIIRNPNIIIACVLVFFSVALDLGFSYWLAEYFKTELGVSMRLSSAVVSIYIAGILSGRLLISWLIKKTQTKNLLITGLCIAFVSLAAFILVPVISAKAVFVCIYGFGVAPVFPLIMSKATEEYPGQSGSVTGLLFGCMSAGGMVFPLLLGVMAGSIGIERSYFFSLFIAAVMLAGILIWVRKRKQPVE